MNLFSLLGGSLKGTENIPQFKQGADEDAIDLQIKSLLYIFKRLKIHKLAPFVDSDGSLRHYSKDEDEVKSGNAYHKKLDYMYNLSAFEKVLLADKYRVMIDFMKNKFRSFCIVSSFPTPNLSRPSSPVKGVASGVNEDFPAFKDYKDRRVRNFRFILLPTEDISIDSIANTLSGSDIYIEHSLTFGSRYGIAMEAIDKVIADERRLSASDSITITKAERAVIIENYLHKLAFNIQLNRIYEEYVKQYPIVKPATKTRTLRTSKSVSALNADYKTHTISSAKLNLKSSFSNDFSTKLTLPVLEKEPKKGSATASKTLRSRPSLPRIKLEDSNKVSEKSTETVKMPKSSITLTSSITGSTHFNEFRADVYLKCKHAVQDKLSREKLIIDSNREY